MDKESREKFAFELRLKEVQFLDKDTQSLFYKLIAGLGILVWFLFTIGVIDAKNPQIVRGALNIITLLFIYVVYWQYQLSKYVEDCYNGVFGALKSDKIFDYYLPSLRWYHAFYYSKRINSNSKSLATKKRRWFTSKDHVMNYTYNYFGGIMAALTIAYILGQNPLGYPWYSILIFAFITYFGGFLCVSLILLAFIKK